MRHAWVYVSTLNKVGMRCNNPIVLDGAAGEVGKWPYFRIVPDFAFMENHIRTNGTIVPDNGIA